MILALFYIVAMVALGFIELTLYGISALVPDTLENGITNAVSSVGTKIQSVYHLIPGADALWNCILAIIIILAAYFTLRVGVFFYNEIRGSGGAI